MFVQDKYQPPIINTYPITPEMREWRVLGVSEQTAVSHKRLIIAAVLTTLWAAAAVSIYFLATTLHGATPNAVYISPVAVGVLGTSVLTGAIGGRRPVLKAPKFENPGVSEAMILHITQSNIDTLCEYLEQNGGVSPLVQRGFILPDQGKVLTDYMAKKAQKTPIQATLDDLKEKWVKVQATIQAKYVMQVTLGQFIEHGELGGVSRSSRVVVGGTLDTLLKNYNTYNRIVEGFESQAVASGQYEQAKKALLDLEKQWQVFKLGTTQDMSRKNLP